MDLREKYEKEVVPKMEEMFGYTNKFAVPRIEKVVVNTGIGKYLSNESAREHIVRDLTLITGQKPIPTKARHAIASFKIREGMVVGHKVTLRGKRMFDFLTRFIVITLPRVRDFRGVESRAVDPSGNLTIGIKEQIVFPEISRDEITEIFGLEVTVSTTASTRDEALALFRFLGFPFTSDS